MTRKDYVLLASILRDARKENYLDRKTIDVLVHRFSQELVRDNGRFPFQKWVNYIVDPKED